MEILKKFKINKPENLYVSEYLTKYRAALIYKLRNLKKVNKEISAAYIFNGNCCVKLDGKTHVINNTNTFNTFVSHHKFVLPDVSQ